MTQLRPSTSNFIISGAADIIVAGNSQYLGNFARSTLPLHESNLPSNISETAEPSSTSELASSKKAVEAIWRIRTKKTKDAKPVPFQTMLNAQEFLEKLSVHFSTAPEVDIVPDGDLTLEWETSKGSLTVLMDERQIYFYSKSMNGKRRKGAEPWDATIPREVLDILGNLLSE